MSFQIKDFQSVAASMINYAKATQKKITDFTVGSAMRTVIECAAIEIDELYQQMWLGLKEGIPIALYQAFNFYRIAPTPAQGIITLTVSAGTAYTLSAGTRFTASDSSSVVYESVDDVSIGSGAGGIPVLVSSIVDGVTKPVAVATPFTVSAPRFVSATALAAFMNGSAEETDAQRKQRFTEYIKGLARSTETAMEYGAKTAYLLDGDGGIAERVKYANVIDVVVGDVVQANCYIHNGVSGASTGLVDECDKVLRGHTDPLGNKITGWKAAGVKLIVSSTANLTVNVSGTVATAVGADHPASVSAVEDAITAYFQSLNIGQGVIHAEIITAAMNVPEVTDFTMSAPTGNVAVSAYEKAIQGVYAIA